MRTFGRTGMEHPMCCQGCGKELPGDASFCPGCGRPSAGKMTDADTAKFPVRDFLEAETPEELNAIVMSDNGASLARFAQKYKAYGADPDFIDDYIKLGRMRDGMDLQTLIAGKEVSLRKQAERLEIESAESPVPRRWWLKTKAWLIRRPRVRRWLAQPSERDRREWKIK
jgi:hypothetical protein